MPGHVALDECCTRWWLFFMAAVWDPRIKGSQQWMYNKRVSPMGMGDGKSFHSPRRPCLSQFILLGWNTMVKATWGERVGMAYAVEPHFAQAGHRGLGISFGFWSHFLCWQRMMMLYWGQCSDHSITSEETQKLDFCTVSRTANFWLRAAVLSQCWNHLGSF